MLYYGFAAFDSFFKITTIAFWMEMGITYCHLVKKHYHFERKAEERPNKNLYEGPHFIHLYSSRTAYKD
jgi:hypothetical protein